MYKATNILVGQRVEVVLKDKLIIHGNNTPMCLSK